VLVIVTVVVATFAVCRGAPQAWRIEKIRPRQIVELSLTADFSNFAIDGAGTAGAARVHAIGRGGR